MNFPLIMAVAALCAFGWLMLYSATGQVMAPGSDAFRQTIYMVVGLGLMVTFTMLDYDLLGKLAWLMYAANLAVLVAVMLPSVGHASHGAQRWVSLGPLGAFQPSEVAKLVVIITVARFLADCCESNRGEPLRLWQMLLAFMLAFIPFALVLLQPDLGTALVIVAVTMCMLFVAGASPVILAGIVTLGAACAPLVLKPYQRQRLLTFLHPESDPRGAGYHLIQSKTAIGAGQVWGSGIFSGVMSQHQFVPENHTDFIFSVVGEELGLVGCLSLFALYILLIASMVRAASASRDVFGALLVSGVLALIGFHAVVNIGMAVGVMPVVGVPLPFVSYGGSALLTDMMAVGIVSSVYFRGADKTTTY